MSFGDALKYPFTVMRRESPSFRPAFNINEPLKALDYCNKRLDWASSEAIRREEYFKGEQPLGFITQSTRDALDRTIQDMVVNLPALKINSIAERLEVAGFRTPTTSLYKPAWDIWQRNNMDEQSRMAHIEAFIHGRSYFIVWGGPDGKAVVSAESARQVWAYRDPRTREPVVAVKRWVENDGYAWAVLYMPDRIITYRSATQNADTSDIYSDPNEVTDLSHVQTWKVIDRQDNPLGKLPVVPLVNRPTILHPDGVTELDKATLAISDGVNKLATDMMVTSEFYTGPRRWATGVELETDEEGNPRENFDRLAFRTWIAEDPAARFGQLPEADLDQFVNGIGYLNSAFASTGSIPEHYMDPRLGQQASAESIRAGEAQLVLKALGCMKSFNGSYETMARLACKIEGIGDDLSQLETVWANPEIRTEAQRVDAAIKRKALEVPVEQAWEDAGYSAAQIKHMKKLRDKETSDGTGPTPGTTNQAPGNGTTGAPGTRPGGN